MKKSKLLILLTASSVAAVTAVVLAPKGSGSKLSATECDHEISYHYGYVAATSDHVGRKEYWICCECNQVFFEKPDVGTFAEGRDDYFDTNVEHDVLIEAHEHYDIGGDGKCDEPGCLEEVASIESLTVTCPLDWIGNKESVIMTANVVAHGGASEDVTWKISDTTNFTLIDNKDGTAKITSKWSSSGSSKTATVTATSKFDGSVFGTCTIKSWNYSDSRIKGVDTVAGKTNRPPYFYVSPANFVTKTDDAGTYAVASNTFEKNATVYEQSIAAFENSGVYTKTVVGDKTYFSKDSADDLGKTVEYCIYKTATTTEIECRLIEKTLDSFPSALVDEFLSNQLYKTSSVVVVPETATNYGYYKKNSLFRVNVKGGDLDEYLGQLEAADYYVLDDDYSVGNEFKCISPERTLVLELVDNSTYYSIEFSTQSAPAGLTEWPESAKNLMTSYLGEVLPFADVGYGTWSDQSKDYGYISTSTSRKEAYPLTLAAFEADSSFVKESEGVNNAVFTKQVDDSHQIKISISSGLIRAEMIIKAETTWFTNEIAEALGSDAKEALPAAVGTGYYYDFDAANHAVSIKVVGDMYAYRSVLEGANYELQDYDWYGVQGVSPTGTISVTVDYDGNNYDAFIIEAYAHMPEGTTLVFPTDAVKGALGVESVPEAEGTLFVFEKGEGSTCSVEVTGSKDSFLASLTEFTEESGVYSNESMNVKLSVEDIDDGIFKISFSRVKEPELGAWPSEQIKASMEALSMTTTSIPAPSVFTSAEFKSNQSQKIGYYTYYYDAVEIKGADVESYISELSKAGFNIYDSYPASNMTDVYDYGCDFYVDHRSSDVIIIMIVSDYDY